MKETKVTSKVKQKQTHTIRGAGVQPIVTFKPWMLELLCNARIESAMLVITKFKQDYKQLTGRELLIDYKQQEQIMRSTNQDKNSYWTSHYSKVPIGLFCVMNYFHKGFLQGTLKDIEVELDEVELFYDLLDLAEENRLLEQS